jgi:hypothetical protein
LAERLHTTVRDLSARLTVAELAEWQAYDKIERSLQTNPNSDPFEMQALLDAREKK